MAQKRITILLLYIQLLCLNCITCSQISDGNSTDAITIPRDLYDTFLSVIRKDGRKINDKVCVSFLSEENDHQEISTLKQEVQLLRSELTQLKTQQFKRLQEEVKDLEKALAQPTVAFMAELSQTITNPAVGLQIVFDQVYLNHGNAYNSEDGTFVAPVNGTYHFSLELSFPQESDNSLRATHVHLKHRTRVIGYIYGDGATAYWLKRSVTAVVDLTEGDNVYAIVNYGAGKNKIGGGILHSVFSGFLVRPKS